MTKWGVCYRAKNGASQADLFDMTNNCGGCFYTAEAA